MNYTTVDLEKWSRGKLFQFYIRPVRKPSESMLEVKDAANERGAKAKLFTFIAVA